MKMRNDVITKGDLAQNLDVDKLINPNLDYNETKTQIRFLLL